MPALASTAAHTSQVLRPDMPYVVLLKDKKFSEPIARARVQSVASQLAHALAEIDRWGEYMVIMARNRRFDWCLVDLRMQPNMIVVECIGRTEIAIALGELIKIDPSNQARYAIARCGELDIQEAHQ